MVEVVNMLWIGDKLSPMEELSINSFLRWGYPVKLWTYKKFSVPEGTTLCNANLILPESRIFKYKHTNGYGGFANLFRYKLLAQYGGCWSDCDIVLMQELPDKDIFVSESDDYACNCFIQVQPNDPTILACLEEAESKDPNRLTHGETGPILLTKYTTLHDREVQFPDFMCPIHWTQWKYFLEDKEIPNSVGIHLWHEMWRRHSYRKDIFPYGTLYSKLQKLVEN